jgi:hypothetical protein
MLLAVSCLGTLEASSGKSRQRTIAVISIPVAILCALALAMLSTLHPPVLWLAYVGAAMIVIPGANLGLTVRRHSKMIAIKLAHIESVSRFALTNFDRVSAPAQADERLITVSSTSEALLALDMTEEDRQALSSLRLHLGEIGHEIADERSYVFTFGKHIQASPMTITVYGASQVELQSWPNIYRERNRSWLPRA